jgi:hypothetical protein
MSEKTKALRNGMRGEELAPWEEGRMTPEEALEELVRIVQETGCPRCRHGRDGTCEWRPVPDGVCVGFQSHDRLTKR